MQDYNYIWEGCMEVTFEISCCKFPLRRELPRFWEDNKQSLLAYLGEAHKGVRGIVSDGNNNPVAKAFLRISNRTIGFKTTSRGEYWRVLRPGRYTLEVSAPGFHTTKQDFVVLDQQISILNVTLKSLEGPVEDTSLLTQPQELPPPSDRPATVPSELGRLDSLSLDQPAIPPRLLYNGYKAQTLPNNNAYDVQPLRH